MGLMPTWLAIYRLVKQLRGLFADARVELFDFEACLRVREFQFTRGGALYTE
jgi:hypothetical protein